MPLRGFVRVQLGKPSSLARMSTRLLLGLNLPGVVEADAVVHMVRCVLLLSDALVELHLLACGD